MRGLYIFGIELNVRHKQFEIVVAIEAVIRYSRYKRIQAKIV